MMMQQIQKSMKAFTLIELLVVMAIISALVGILSVGLRTVKIKATNLKQKGEFHGMEISVELYRNDFDRYPGSAEIDGGGGDYVCGAQRLAEAMEGRDERGFHPKSKWHPNLETSSLYDDKTLPARMPVYFELKHTGFFTLDDLWGSSNTGSLHGTMPVLTDVFVRNQAANTAINEKVGSPVLYYVADPTKRFRVDSSNQPVNNPQPQNYENWVYNYDDNLRLLDLVWLRDPGADPEPGGIGPHYQPANNEKYPNATTPVELFYEILTQRQSDTNNDGTIDYFKPYNQSTFILISAGWDGIYGTDDDLTNFNY